GQRRVSVADGDRGRPANGGAVLVGDGEGNGVGAIIGRGEGGVGPPAGGADRLAVGGGGGPGVAGGWRGVDAGGRCGGVGGAGRSLDWRCRAGGDGGRRRGVADDNGDCVGVGQRADGDRDRDGVGAVVARHEGDAVGARLGDRGRAAGDGAPGDGVRAGRQV